MTRIELAASRMSVASRQRGAAPFARALALASFELRATLRGRMVPTFALLFAIVAAGLALAGLGGSGQLLVQGFTRTAASLMSLGYYMMPLLGLLLGAMAFAANSAAMEAIAAQPVGVTELVLGRALGLLGAIALVVLAGFGSAMVFIAISYVFGPLRQVTMGLRVLAGILTGLVLRYFGELAGTMSLVYEFSPLLAATLPLVLGMTIGLWALRRSG